MHFQSLKKTLFCYLAEEYERKFKLDFLTNPNLTAKRNIIQTLKICSCDFFTFFPILSLQFSGQNLLTEVLLGCSSNARAPRRTLMRTTLLHYLPVTMVQLDF